jgi:nitrogen fixation NifU-like protein
MGNLLRCHELAVMSYSEKLLDHYANPRNVGSFARRDPRVGTGMAGSPLLGDVIKIQIKVNGQGVIADACFKTYGGAAAIATSSWLTEWVKGKTLEEAQAIKHTQIAEQLALPAEKIPCSVLAEDALKAAIGDYRANQRSKYTV